MFTLLTILAGCFGFIDLPTRQLVGVIIIVAVIEGGFASALER